MSHRIRSYFQRIADNLLFGVETACPGNNAEGDGSYGCN